MDKELNNDDELSLAVAKVMWPEYEWSIRFVELDEALFLGVRTGYHAYTETPKACEMVFDYTTDDAGMKMCVWLAAYSFDNMKKIGNDKVTEIHDKLILALANNDNRSIAELIRETSNEH